MEHKLPELFNEKKRADKLLLDVEWVLGILSILILIIPILIVGHVPMENDWLKTAIILSGVIPFLVGISFAVKIEQIAGYYKCAVCGHCHVPTFTGVLLAPHMGRTRHMRCPACGKKSWQKKVLTKE